MPIQYAFASPNHFDVCDPGRLLDISCTAVEGAENYTKINALEKYTEIQTSLRIVKRQTVRQVLGQSFEMILVADRYDLLFFLRILCSSCSRG
jgi:hypothetical protein